MNDPRPFRLGKHTQHGLGQFLNPTNPDSDDRADRDWIGQAWRRLMATDLGHTPPELPWLDLPALCKYTVSNPRLHNVFRRHNAGRTRAGQVWPFNFIAVARISPYGHPASHTGGPFRLIAPYTTDVAKTGQTLWTNKDAPGAGPYTITTDPERDADTSPHEAIVVSYRQALHDYLHHPEAKYADQHGQPCGPDTRGPLRRHPVHIRSLRLIGKESNNVGAGEAGLITPTEAQAVYGIVDLELADALRALKHLSAREVARTVGCDRRSIDRIRAGSRPRPRLRDRIIARASQVMTGDSHQHPQSTPNPP